MRRIIGWLLFCVLTTIAIIHAYWAFGGLWPSDNVQGLINTVIGDPRWTAMPGMAMTLVVAFCIFSAAILALDNAKIISIIPNWISKIGIWVLIGVFGLRGLSGLAVGLGLRTLEPPLTEPFATNDMWFYSPLCLIIMGGFLILAITKVKS